MTNGDVTWIDKSKAKYPQSNGCCTCSYACHTSWAESRSKHRELRHINAQVPPYVLKSSALPLDYGETPARHL